MARPKVVLTNPSVPVGENIIREVADLLVAPDPGFDTMRSLIGDCDVLVVRGMPAKTAFQRPLVAIDFTPAATKALVHAGMLIPQGTTIDVIHAMKSTLSPQGAHHSVLAANPLQSSEPSE